MGTHVLLDPIPHERRELLAGEVVGHIEELGVTWTNEGALVTEVRLGSAALLERLSAVFRSPPESLRVPWHQIDLTDPKHPRLRVRKDQIEKI